MNRGFLCKILGHKLTTTPAQYSPEMIIDGFTGQKVLKPAHRISNGIIICERPGCKFHEPVWDFNRIPSEVREAKFKGSLWQSRAWKNLVEWTILMSWIVFWLAIVGLIVYVFVAIPDQKYCSTLSTKFALKTVWEFWTGCMIHSDKFGWVPDEKYFQILNLSVQ